MNFPVTYVRLLARELRLDAAGQRRLLAGTALAPADLVRLEQVISEADWLRVIGNALALAARPGFALEVGSRLSLAAHGPLGQLLSSGPSLAQAWAALARFHVLRVPLLKIRCRSERGHFFIELQHAAPLDAVGLFLVEALVVTVQRGIELIIGRHLREAEFHFAYAAPAHAALYGRHLHGRCRFSCTATAVRVPLALVQEANPFQDPQLWARTLEHCEALSAQLDDATALRWRDRVTQLLRQQPGQLWTLVQVADFFHLSSRTLMRYLKAEGVQYQQLLDAELRRQAQLHLQSPRHTVESTALALGYQDATAFRRAFRRWCGESPSAWLARQR
jgi:AraC-like DNA-binding protein